MSKYEEIKNVIIPIFDNFPLKTTKKYDYINFKKAFELRGLKGTILSENIYNNIIELKNKMNLSKDYSLVALPVNICPYWLIGFCEAEATFGLKGLKPYFQIPQKDNNKELLNSIELFLINLPNAFELTLGSLPKKASIGKNKKTNVLLYVYSDIDFLHDYILPFFYLLFFILEKR